MWSQPTYIGWPSESSEMPPTYIGWPSEGSEMLPTYIGWLSEGSEMLPTYIGWLSEGSEMPPTYIGWLSEGSEILCRLSVLGLGQAPDIGRLTIYPGFSFPVRLFLFPAPCTVAGPHLSI